MPSWPSTIKEESGKSGGLEGGRGREKEENRVVFWEHDPIFGKNQSRIALWQYSMSCPTLAKASSIRPGLEGYSPGSRPAGGFVTALA